jgi:putative transposase
MMELGYRLKRKRNYKRTTIAGNKFYPNLIKGLEIYGPFQVWQNDITYIPIGDRHYYATFIIDVYTPKIVGYNVTDNMRATANVQALTIALKTNAALKIHHYRSIQYTYREYIELLVSNGSRVSMALSSPDNSYSERINKTMKEEYLHH